MSINYQNNQRVKYNNGHISGIGVVKGIATTGNPVIGINYILVDEDNKFPDDCYKFEAFTMFECHMNPEPSIAKSVI